MIPRIRTLARLVTVVCIVLGTSVAARAQPADPTFNPAGGRSIEALVIQPDGKILIGGPPGPRAGRSTGSTRTARSIPASLLPM